MRILVLPRAAAVLVPGAAHALAPAAGAGLAQAAPGPQPAALLAYRTHLHREPPVQTPRSSVWRHRAGERKMVFHRATA